MPGCCSRSLFWVFLRRFALIVTIVAAAAEIITEWNNTVKILGIKLVFKTIKKVKEEEEEGTILIS